MNIHSVTGGLALLRGCVYTHRDRPTSVTQPLLIRAPHKGPPEFQSPPSNDHVGDFVEVLLQGDLAAGVGLLEQTLSVDTETFQQYPQPAGMGEGRYWRMRPEHETRPAAVQHSGWGKRSSLKRNQRLASKRLRLTCALRSSSSVPVRTFIAGLATGKHRIR